MYNAFMKKARYICLEGTEGVGKTTQTQLLVDVLRARGFRVLQTKEPGTSLVPLTMVLRGVMLDAQYDAEMTRPARELISQAIRSIHMERLVLPSLYDYDFIIQDRGVLSGLAYGAACGNEVRFLNQLIDDVMPIDDYTGKTVDYERVVYLRGDSKKGLARAKTAKQEFAAGDAMEAKGDSFITQVSKNMDFMSEGFPTVRIETDGKSIHEVHQEILASLQLKDDK